MKLYPGKSYFTTEEFQCPCDCGFGKHEDDIDADLVDRLNMMRVLYGKSMVVTSGARCEDYNASIGGVEHSAHLPHPLHGRCRAVDILVRNGQERLQLVDLARKVGIERIGVASNFLHFDVEAELLPTPAMFNY